MHKFEVAHDVIPVRFSGDTWLTPIIVYVHFFHCLCCHYWCESDDDMLALRHTFYRTHNAFRAESRAMYYVVQTATRERSTSGPPQTRVHFLTQRSSTRPPAFTSVHANVISGANRYRCAEWGLLDALGAPISARGILSAVLFYFFYFLLLFFFTPRLTRLPWLEEILFSPFVTQFGSDDQWNFYFELIFSEFSIWTNFFQSFRCCSELCDQLLSRSNV